VPVTRADLNRNRCFRSGCEQRRSILAAVQQMSSRRRNVLELGYRDVVTATFSV
jgi:hypothetical protein